MERLTKRDEFGNADIIGVDSADLQLNLEYDEFNKVTDALNKLAEYEDAEEQGLLYRKVWTIQSFCHKPKDCEGDCECCHMNELDIEEGIIKYSDFNEEIHYKTKEEAEQKLAEMKGESNG